MFSLYTLFGITAPPPQQPAIPPDPEVQEEVVVEETVVEEEPVEEPEEEVEVVNELNFSYADQFPAIWGKIRIVEPLLVEFRDIKVEEGFFLLNNNEVRITGKIIGLEPMKYTYFAEDGYFTMLSTAIFDNSGEIKWSQNGYPIDDSYISENEVREFLLISQYKSSISNDDNLIIIAHIEGGVIEDEQIEIEEIDKGVFGVYEDKCNIAEVGEEPVEEGLSEDKEIELKIKTRITTLLGKKTNYDLPKIVDIEITPLFGEEGQEGNTAFIILNGNDNLTTNMIKGGYVDRFYKII